MMIDYNKRLVEVDEVLKYLSKSDFEKIPKDIIDAIKKNKDKNYVWNYDEKKSFAEQNLPRDTIIILSYLNTEYLLNNEQKVIIEKIHENNERKAELEKSINYEKKLNSKKSEELSNENYGKNNFDTEIIKNDENNNTQLQNYKENIFVKIKNFLKKCFNIK